jgi:hypothetical protein
MIALMGLALETGVSMLVFLDRSDDEATTGDMLTEAPPRSSPAGRRVRPVPEPGL